MRRAGKLITACVLMILFTGCQTMLHELQPHRLGRTNYGPGPGQVDVP